MSILNSTTSDWEYNIAKQNAKTLIDTVDGIINRRNTSSESIRKLNKYIGRLKYYLGQYKYRCENNLNSYVFSCKVNICMQDIVSYIIKCKGTLGTYWYSED